MKHYENEHENEKKGGSCKRRIALAMAGLLTVGTIAGIDAWRTASVVFAEEDETQGVTLNIADSDEKDAETEIQTEETETETEKKQKETYAEIDRVSGDAAIVATDVSDIVEDCMPSIVSITEKSVEEIETYYYGVQEYEMTGAASGIIIAQNDEELLIATNSHVVKDSTEITVGLTAEAEDPEDLLVPAKIKGMDRDYELAVIAVQLSDIKEEIRDQLRIAQLGSSAGLRVGETAIAIGNAMGYGQSVTCGVISALDRDVTIDNFSQKLILMDAPVNHGNSGGALLNAKGQVIGINLAKEVVDTAEGMGYSIPIDTAIPVLEKLVNKETRDKKSDSERGYLGITVVDVSADAKELYNIPAGAFVYEVTEDSAGEKAGIHKGDVVTKLDGESVTDKDDLVDKLCYYSAGETVTLEVQTANGGDYEAREVEVTLQEGTDLPEEEEAPKDSEDSQQSAQENAEENAEGQTEGDFWFDGFGVPGQEDDGSFFPFGGGENEAF